MRVNACAKLWCCGNISIYPCIALCAFIQNADASSKLTNLKRSGHLCSFTKVYVHTCILSYTYIHIYSYIYILFPFISFPPLFHLAPLGFRVRPATQKNTSYSRFRLSTEEAEKRAKEKLPEVIPHGIKVTCFYLFPLYYYTILQAWLYRLLTPSLIPSE